MLRPILKAFLATAVVSLTAVAQTRPAAPGGGAPSQYKGVLEPVSFSEDIDLLGVVFVTPDVGWAAGKNGTIIHTTDGGKTWDAQLGGDPASNVDNIRVLHFLDERRGWAIMGRKTLHTRDGESWEEIGNAPWNVEYMVFTSPRTGFIGGNEGHSVAGAHTIYRTNDGGRTWQPHWPCQAKVNVGGLNRNISCVIGQIVFPTPQIGYVGLRTGCVGMGCGGPSLIAKTTDGGNSWQLMNGPGVFEQDEVTSLFFLDENTGFARLTSKKLHMTTDGGATWRGIVASPGTDIEFADPSVGWAVDPGWSELRVSFTTDGGRRWTSREIRLPATTRAFSLPRRDRAYIVGDHGMVFRYRLVPVSTPMVANAVEAPAMPVFESALDDQIAQLETVLTDMSTELEAFTPPPASQAGGVTPAGKAFNLDSASTADSIAAWNEPFSAPLPPATGFTANCCKKSFSRLELTLGLMSQSLPQFVSQYKNLNLLLAALRMSTELPGDYRNLKGGLRTFRTAQDKESAKAALAEVLASLKALKQTTAESMQQVLPAVPEGGDAGPAFSPASASASPTQGQAKEKQSGKNEAKEAVKDAAKKGLGGLLKRKP